MVINILVCIGTNLLLDEHITAGNGLLANGLLAKEFITAIVVMENYNEEVHTSFDLLLKSRIVASKFRDMVYFSSRTARRDVLKFYRKRTTCSCLKDMHLEARKILPKLGLCLHCGEEKERASLSVCGRCRITYFCSVECHIALGPKNRDDSKMDVR